MGLIRRINREQCKASAQCIFDGIYILLATIDDTRLLMTHGG